MVQEHPFAYDSGKVSEGTFTVRNDRGEMIEIADSIGGTMMMSSNTSAVIW